MYAVLKSVIFRTKVAQKHATRQSICVQVLVFRPQVTIDSHHN